MIQGERARTISTRLDAVFRFASGKPFAYSAGRAQPSVFRLARNQRALVWCPLNRIPRRSLAPIAPGGNCGSRRVSGSGCRANHNCRTRAPAIEGMRGTVMADTPARCRLAQTGGRIGAGHEAVA